MFFNSKHLEQTKIYLKFLLKISKYIKIFHENILIQIYNLIRHMYFED